MEFFLRIAFGSRNDGTQIRMEWIVMLQFHRNLNIHANLFLDSIAWDRGILSFFSCVPSKQLFMQLLCILSSSFLDCQLWWICVFSFEERYVCFFYSYVSRSSNPDALNGDMPELYAHYKISECLVWSASVEAHLV